VDDSPNISEFNNIIVDIKYLLALLGFVKVSYCSRLCNKVADVLAKQYDLDPAQLALAYVNSRRFVTSNIIGATNLNQLKTNIESIELKLPDEVIQGIEQIHQAHPNPAP